MNDLDFRRHVRHLLFAWVALIALMLCSLGSSYLPLGIGNAVAGTAIATIKSTIVVSLFMGLIRAKAIVRIVAATALGTWFILLALGGLEQLTRASEPARMQPPRQVAPLLEER